jgi:orotate phosphoribosyltransferase
VIGEVVLTSGATASYYVDVKRAILRPAGFAALGELVRERVVEWGASAVGGLTMGADPVACAALVGGSWGSGAGGGPGSGPGAEGGAGRSGAEGGAGRSGAEGGAGRELKAFFVRKETKSHGLQRRIEGPPLDASDRCLVVEDVVTTGGSTLAAIAALQEEGLAICGVLSVLDRLAGGGAAIEAAAGAPYVALTTIDDVYPERPR